ncbi:MAG: hypothetical protein QME27_09400, partial [Syntrophaceae bacterium]|nr:hypothetical protein [Syntrophaceae bacterium]
SCSGARGGLPLHSRRKGFSFERADEEVKILPPLFIYRDDGRYSKVVQGIFNGLSLSRSVCV